MASMDGKTMDEIRKVLMERWRDLGGRGESGAGSEARPAAVPEIDAGAQAEIIDIAQNLEQLDRDSSLAEQERRKLVAIERALAKMATGSFGVCEECGEDIPPKRLMVLPEARYCANCQAFQERQSARIRQAAAR
ncbi:MAG: TraR/DksA family transcriptional regulator [Oligoflexia bacterium]|nr:TraR/DksA family transcriptional regulator [Oligoflexia bacterium]